MQVKHLTIDSRFRAMPEPPSEQQLEFLKPWLKGR